MIATFAGDSARIMLVQEAINGLPASTHPHYNVSTEDPGGGVRLLFPNFIMFMIMRESYNKH